MAQNRRPCDDFCQEIPPTFIRHPTSTHPVSGVNYFFRSFNCRRSLLGKNQKPAQTGFVRAPLSVWIERFAHIIAVAEIDRCFPTSSSFDFAQPRGKLVRAPSGRVFVARQNWATSHLCR